jgi:TonB-dependent starch-binding outer membrane protein SusC
VGVTTTVTACRSTTKGTAAYNYFKRGSVRVNTAFQRNKFSFGENLAVAVERNTGGLDDGAIGEDNIVGKNILMQPVVPIYDVRGNFASGKAVGLGNQSNPLKYAFAHKDDQSKWNRVFGNLFGGYEPVANLSLMSRLGFNLGEGSNSGFNPIFPENSEETLNNSITEYNTRSTDWTWSNTATYRYSLDQNNFSFLAGQEANASNFRRIDASMASLINDAVPSRYIQDALGDAASKNVTSTGGRSALLSVFGKVDYNYAEKYIASLTMRRDGSSNIAPEHRWGTFPAVGLGWRITREPFLASNSMFNDVLLRFGWGVTGNQLIPSGRIVSQFGGSRAQTFYDITGSNTNIAPGYRQTSLGNPDLKWEENTSVNVGADLAVWNNRLNVVLDVFQRTTDNLLFDPPTPGTAGSASPPIVNIGKMKNTGFDFSVGHRAPTWNVTFNGSHYKNKIVQITGDTATDFFYGPISTRFGNQVINIEGEAIGSFYGLVADGFFNNPAEVAAHATQDGKAPGRIRFKDINGDGAVTLADRTIIGSPHPDFTAGLDMGYRWKAFDVSGTVFGTFGNEIFDTQKEYYIFRNFSTNVREDMLTDSWTPVDATVARDQFVAANPNAKYPILDFNDNYSRALSSFYVEDGSYVRMRNLQIGYTLPASARWLAASRVYLQAENLFTITGYEGLDPSLPAASVFGAAGDIRDQYRGIDRGTYPSSRVFSLGIVTSF